MRKPYALTLTDTHATPNNLKLQESIWKQAVRYCLDNKIPTIYHMGDWVTARKAQSLEVLKHLDWVKKLLYENGIVLIGISGNHDKSNQESIFAYPNIYGNDIDFRIVEERYDEQLSDSVHIHLLPYFPETGSYNDKLEDAKKRVVKGKKNILLTHAGVNGGLAHENATVNKEIPADAFVGFDMVLIGHYHNRNKIDFDLVDIWYTGSAFASNYGEDNEKGFTIIYDDGSIEFVNSEFPKFETIEVEVDKVDGKWLSETKKHISDTGNNVRVVVTGDESELKSISKQKFSNIGVKKLKLNTENISVRNDRNEVVFVNLDKATVKKEYKKFCVNNEIDHDFGFEYLNL